MLQHSEKRPPPRRLVVVARLGLRPRMLGRRRPELLAHRPLHVALLRVRLLHLGGLPGRWVGWNRSRQVSPGWPKAGCRNWAGRTTPSSDEALKEQDTSTPSGPILPLPPATLLPSLPLNQACLEAARLPPLGRLAPAALRTTCLTSRHGVATSATHLEAARLLLLGRLARHKVAPGAHTLVPRLLPLLLVLGLSLGHLPLLLVLSLGTRLLLLYLRGQRMGLEPLAVKWRSGEAVGRRPGAAGGQRARHGAPA